MSGRASSTKPNTIETRPPSRNMARVPADSPARKAEKISTKPLITAQVPTITTSTSAVGNGQASAITPAAKLTRPNSR